MTLQSITEFARREGELTGFLYRAVEGRADKEKSRDGGAFNGRVNMTAPTGFAPGKLTSGGTSSTDVIMIAADNTLFREHEAGRYRVAFEGPHGTVS